ncbi:RraA family protein [Mesorhizobium sp. SB112]|uniref:RraA family protein n=1 Tax=Mesorhizobium sp. SB112 TaxID=3151853 RepID=UPI003265A4C2
MLIHDRAAYPVADDIMTALGKSSPASFGHHLEGGIVGGGIRHLAGAQHMVGRAATLDLPLPDGIPLHLALDHIEPGDVVVIAKGGDDKFASVGEMTARMSAAKGAAGFVVDGSVTDIRELREIGLPVYAKSLSVATHRPLNLSRAELFGTVSVGGVVIRADDIILGDENGLIVLDPAMPNLPALVRRCIADEEREVVWRERLSSGVALSELSNARTIAAKKS